MKRGVSPIVAVVLLIAVSIVAATGLYFWTAGIATKQPVPAQPNAITAVPLGGGKVLIANLGSTSISTASLATTDPAIDIECPETIPAGQQVACNLTGYTASESFVIYLPGGSSVVIETAGVLDSDAECTMLPYCVECLENPECVWVNAPGRCTRSTCAIQCDGSSRCYDESPDIEVCGDLPAPVCGDGVIEGSEECDDSNTDNGDCCNSTCYITEKPEAFEESCDDGIDNDCDGHADLTDGNCDFACEGLLNESRYLESDVHCPASAFYMNAENVILDCQGHTLSGEGNGYGVHIIAANGTVRNCVIRGFRVGVGLTSSFNRVENNTIDNSSYFGIETLWLASSVNDTIIGNTITNTGNAEGAYWTGAIQLQPYSDYIWIENNTITNTTVTAGLMNFIGGTHNYVKDNVFVSGATYDFECDYGADDDVIDLGGNICYQRDSCSLNCTTPVSCPQEITGPCYIDKPQAYTLAGNLTATGTLVTFYSSASTITGASLDCQGKSMTGNGSGYGVLLQGSNLTVRNCLINNFNVGIGIAGSNNTIENNTVNDSANYGISTVWLAESYYNLIKNNTISNTRNDLNGYWLGAITLQTYADNNTLEDNVVTNSAAAGVMIFLGGANNPVTGNRVTGSGGNDLDCTYETYSPGTGNVVDGGGNVCVNKDSCNLACAAP